MSGKLGQVDCWQVQELRIVKVLFRRPCPRPLEENKQVNTATQRWGSEASGFIRCLRNRDQGGLQPDQNVGKPVLCGSDVLSGEGTRWAGHRDG